MRVAITHILILVHACEYKLCDSCLVPYYVSRFPIPAHMHTGEPASHTSVRSTYLTYLDKYFSTYLLEGIPHYSTYLYT